MCTSNMARIRYLGEEKAIIQKIKPEFIKYYMQQGRIIEPIPCGNCAECKAEEQKQKAFRIAKELEYHENNIMVTFTYDDEHLPINTVIDEETGEIKQVPTLQIKDMQRVLNSLQKHFKGFRKAYCGEYGKNEEYIDSKGNKRIGTERPHYHCILYGIKFEDMRFYKYSVCEWSRQKNKLYKSDWLTKLWGMGHVDLNEANYETANYIAGYVTKKMKDKKKKQDYENEGRVAPFLQTSRKPGLAYKYFEENKEKFKEDGLHYIMTKKGLKEIKPGRYFDKILEKEDPELLQQLKKQRRKRSQKILEETLKQTELKASEYIENRESSALNRMRFQKRQLT